MLLQATGLSARVEGRTLFEGLSFGVPAGGRLVVRGASGSGKTTLLRQLAGLTPLESGTVTLDGVEQAELDPATWRTGVAWVPQRVPDLPGTPAELRARVEAFAARSVKTDPVELAASWALPPSAWDKPWSRLSGGERRRALLALAVAGDPAILLLDEPTSGLDPDSAAAVEAFLRGRTALWVTHDPAQATRVGAPVVRIGP
jgi:putative ABC transport system ATP-binding protein